MIRLNDNLLCWKILVCPYLLFCVPAKFFEQQGFQSALYHSSGSGLATFLAPLIESILLIQFYHVDFFFFFLPLAKVMQIRRISRPCLE